MLCKNLKKTEIKEISNPLKFLQNILVFFEAKRSEAYWWKRSGAS